MLTMNKEEKDTKDNEEYIPNEVPLHERMKLFFLSGAFIIHGGYSVWNNEFSIGHSRRKWGWLTGNENREPILLHDEAAIVFYLGLLLVSVCFLSEVVDHYDRRNNEHVYHKIAKFTLFPGIILCILAFFLK